MAMRATAQDGSAAGAPTDLETALATISALIEDQMSIPGVSLGGLKDGTTHIRSFGITSVEDPLPIDENTTFEIASLSRTVTATAVMQLVEAGRLDLDAPVRTYLPDWTVAEEGASRDMLVRHLISHSTGLNGPASTEDLGRETLERFAASMDRLSPSPRPARSGAT